MSDGRREWSIISKLVIYPLLFCVAWVPSFVHRIMSFSGVDDSDMPRWFLRMYVALSFMSGLANAVTFGLTNKVCHRELARCFRRK